MSDSNINENTSTPDFIDESGMFDSQKVSLADRLSIGRQRRNPDVLDTLSSLSNDEVFTPPEIAKKMIALLPESLWSDPNTKVLDPSSKSGVFLREIAKLLNTGLKEIFPDTKVRQEHIFKNMLFGLPITNLTGDISRRTLYYSKDATAKESIIKMESPQGNFPFSQTNHVFKSGKSACSICGAQAGLERGQDRDNHAYSFIHPRTDKRIEEILKMEFDVIIGNPPYQLKDDGHGASASPLYHKFVEAALALNPRYICMITPSRWMIGGKGLDDFRKTMLTNKRISHMVDYPDASECFPGVKIKGGVSYFLWDRNDAHEKCSVTTILKGETISTMMRDLDSHDIFIRFSDALPILEKVQVKNETTMDNHVSSRKPFGFQTNFKDYIVSEKIPSKNYIKIYANRETGWIEKNRIILNKEWVSKWKVLTSKAGAGDAVFPNTITGPIIVTEANSCCTETYLVCGVYDTPKEAENMALFLKTRFARFLIALRKTTQDLNQTKFKFVPSLDMNITWTDEKLYKKYGITPEEITFIESIVKEML